MKYNFLYRNFLESKWCFFNGKDTKWLYSEEESKERYNKVWKFFKTINIKRPPNRVIEIQLPISSEECEEEMFLSNFLIENKVEPRMVYVVNQILDDYYYWVDYCFHKRKEKKEVDLTDFWVLFTMREIIDWISRTSPIKVRAFTEKETQKVWFVDWNISQNVRWASFPYLWQRYTTDFYWIYASRFRDAMFPNSDFNWFALQRWQRDMFIKRWRITVVMCMRWWGKSFSNTSAVATYLHKELNMSHEYNRPFLIVYWGISKEANLQVVEYIRAMAKSLTTNKNILKRDKWEQILTLYDGHNERKIKFVSQGQEWSWFRWLRPHLVVLDEAARLDKEMFTVAAGTSEAQIVLISTVDYRDRRNWFYSLYMDAVKKQRDYKDVYELIAETRIKFWMNKIKSQEEYEKAVRDWIIDKMRDYYWKQRPIVGLKYTIDDVEYLTQDQKDRLIETSMLDWEDKCLAEYYSEYAVSQDVFDTEWLLESKIPDRFDLITCWYDEAEKVDNPAIVFAWINNTKTYIIHSEILDKTDYLKKYERINYLLRSYQQKTSRPILFAMDLTRVQDWWLREISAFVREPDYPIQYTSSQQDKIVRKRPYYLIGKRRLVTLSQEEFFKKSWIIFSWDLDVEWWLIEEISHFKYWNRWKIQWEKNMPDDQVNAMMMALFVMYQAYIKDKYSPLELWGIVSQDERLDWIMHSKKQNENQKEIETNISDIIYNYW